jgi:hypothetical protein
MPVRKALRVYLGLSANPAAPALMGLDFANPRDGRFTDAFLVVAPDTIKDRLRLGEKVAVGNQTKQIPGRQHLGEFAQHTFHGYALPSITGLPCMTPASISMR